MSTRESLLPCPFCGKDVFVSRLPVTGVARLGCVECDIWIMNGDEPADLSKIWNRRASKPGAARNRGNR